MVKKNKPEIRFKGFTDDWEQRKLGDECQITMGQSPDGTTYSEEPSDYILVQGNADLKDGWVFPRIWTTQKTKTAQSGNLIMSVRAPAGAMGKTAYDVVLGRGVAGIKGNEFIYQTLVKMDSDGYWKKLAAGSTFESINSDVIKNAEILISQDIEEQEQIGKYFQRLDHLITLHQRKCEKLKNMKKAMLEKLFPKNGSNIPEVRFRGFTDDWEQRKLGEVAKYRNGKAHENCIDDNGKYIVVNSKFVSTDGKVKKFSNMQNEELFENEIAFVLSDVPNGRAIARTFLIEKSDKYTLNQRIAGITPLNESYPYFLYILMNRHPYFLAFDDGAKQTNLSVSDVMEFEAYYPQYNEQQKIGEYFKKLDNLITLHQRQLEKLKNVKKSMLEKMFV
ncbi:restriction endonuclease subunit S [Fusobacterium varium]